MINLNVPYLRDTEIALVADGIRSKNNITSIPVNIEGLIENKFQADIVPVPDMRKNLDFEGSSSQDLGTVYVDEFVYKQRPYRYRFTIAHELGHIVLHPDYFGKLKFTSIVEWTKVVNEIDQRDYSKMEYQAYAFAGQILVPTEFLRPEFSKQLYLYKSQIKEAQEKGFRRDDYVDTVLDEIAYSLSPRFEVSTDVLSRRMRSESLEQEIL